MSDGTKKSKSLHPKQHRRPRPTTTFGWPGDKKERKMKTEMTYDLSRFRRPPPTTNFGWPGDKKSKKKK